MITDVTNASDDSIVNTFLDKKYWGEEALINVYGADIGLIKSKEYIGQFIEDLCDLIKMKRFGEPIIERFGEGDLLGFSAVQLIYTSCVTMHFSEIDGRIFIDVFSCKEFPPEVTAKFAMDYFHGKNYDVKTIFRD